MLHEWNMSYLYHRIRFFSDNICGFPFRELIIQGLLSRVFVKGVFEGRYCRGSGLGGPSNGGTYFCQSLQTSWKFHVGNNMLSVV